MARECQRWRVGFSFFCFCFTRCAFANYKKESSYFTGYPQNESTFDPGYPYAKSEYPNTFRKRNLNWDEFVYPNPRAQRNEMDRRNYGISYETEESKMAVDEGEISSSQLLHPPSPIKEGIFDVYEEAALFLNDGHRGTPFREYLKRQNATTFLPPKHFTPKAKPNGKYGAWIPLVLAFFHHPFEFLIWRFFLFVPYLQRSWRVQSYHISH